MLKFPTYTQLTILSFTYSIQNNLLLEFHLVCDIKENLLEINANKIDVHRDNQNKNYKNTVKYAKNS